LISVIKNQSAQLVYELGRIYLRDGTIGGGGMIRGEDERGRVKGTFFMLAIYQNIGLFTTQNTIKTS